MLRAKNENNSLKTEINNLFQSRSRQGFDKLYLDYIISAPVDSMNPGKFEKRSESTRQLKNASIYMLADYRAKNVKP